MIGMHDGKERRHEMKEFALSAVAVLLIAGIAYAKGYEVKQEAGEFEVEIKIDKPSIGINDITIEVKDRSGKYVTDAKVKAEYSMARGIDVPPMTDRSEAMPDGSRYRTRLTFPMAGAGEIIVHVTRGSEGGAARFNIDVH